MFAWRRVGQGGFLVDVAARLAQNAPCVLVAGGAQDPERLRPRPNALRKSVGDEVGNRAIAEWLLSRPSIEDSDENAAVIVDTLWPLVQQGTLAIPRGGYVLRRGRGGIIVEPAKG